MTAGVSRASTSLPVRLVVLDVGGTIIEDRGDVPEALRSAFAKQGISVTPAEIAALRGASKREVVAHFVQVRSAAAEAERKKLIDAIYADFSARIVRAYQTAKPIAGAEDAFRKMREMGLLLATNTGFDRAITNSIFQRLAWEKYFAGTITSDDVAAGRPSPYMLFHAMEQARVNGVAEMVAVGDTPLDMQAGSNAEARGVIGVLSGVGTEKSLNEEPHTHIIASVAELPELLRAKF